ncbi:hypothetical protein EWM64_g7761 [Hericium alpestre]|uniref:Uncharacterized protein n=1 Tax=Hericium alpestre TaxID=135208 RepID=A0A4Y9ZQZ2_9AGAM|nr:hypothetical protein EWM64_g7761 [Hericium alpestre]
MGVDPSRDGGAVNPANFLDPCLVSAHVNALKDIARSPVSPTIAAKDLVDDVLPYSPLISGSHYASHSDSDGLPSNPISIYYTRDPWPKPTEPEAQLVPKETRPICKHPIAAVWRELGQRVYELFDSLEVKWTSIDPVRFAKVGGEAGPLFLWVSCPGLSSPRTQRLPSASRSSPSAGPQLLNYAPYVDVTADVRSLFTPTLGLRIAPKDCPHFEVQEGACTLGDAVKGENDTIAEARETYKDKLAKAEKTIKFHDDTTKHWSAVSQRVLGLIVHSPPISVSIGPKLLTEDWALIELHSEKIN